MCSLAFSERATTTYSKNDKLLLMNYASRSCLPSEPVFLVRSEPARSTRFNFEMITFSEDSTRDLISRCTVNTQCDLDEFLLSWCWEMVRLVSPSKIIAIASSSVLHFLISSPFTLTCPLLSSYTAKFCVASEDDYVPTNKSYMVSL